METLKANTITLASRKKLSVFDCQTRYANDAVVFPLIVLSELRKRWRDGGKHDRSRRNAAKVSGRARSASRNVL